MDNKTKELREKETVVRFKQLAKMMTAKGKIYLGEELISNIEVLPNRPVGTKTAMVIYLG